MDDVDFGTRLIEALPRLRRYGIVLARAPDVADDLVQATCERALAGRAGLGADDRFDAWLFRILRNLWRDRLRRLKTRGEEVDVDERVDLEAAGAAEAADRRLLLAATAAALEALPDDQRELMLLVCVEELSYREAADILDIPVGTVMSRLARARRRVAETVGYDRDGRL